MISLHFIVFPNWPIYLPSLFKSVPTNVLVFHGIYWSWLMQMLYSNLIFMLTFIFAIFPSFPDILKECICQSDGKRRFRYQKAGREFRSLELLPQIYRQLHLLNVIFLDIFSVFIMPMQSLGSYLLIYCTFSLTRHHNKMHFTIKIILMFFVLFLGIGIFLLLNVCADLHRISNKALI